MNYNVDVDDNNVVMSLSELIMKHPITASRGDLIAQCRVAPALSKYLIGKGKSNEQATQGSKMHKAVAAILTNHLKGLDAKIISSVNENVNLTDDEHDICERVINNVIELSNKVVNQNDDVEIRIEQPSIINGSYIGTADFILINHTQKIALVVDFKFGRVQVSPNSIQLKLYGYEFKDYLVALSVIQPYISGTPAVVTIIKSSEFDDAYNILMEAREYYDNHKATSNDIQSLAKTGKYCKYCNYNKYCSVYQEKILRVLKNMKRINELNNDELYEIYSNEKDINIVLDMVRDELENRIIDNGLDLNLKDKTIAIQLPEVRKSWDKKKLKEIKEFLSNKGIEYADKPMLLSDISVLDEMENMIVSRKFKSKIIEL